MENAVEKVAEGVLDSFGVLLLKASYEPYLQLAQDLSKVVRSLESDGGQTKSQLLDIWRGLEEGVRFRGARTIPETLNTPKCSAIKCGKMRSSEGDQLLRCARCQVTFYCSRSCQKT